MEEWISKAKPRLTTREQLQPVQHRTRRPSVQDADSLIAHRKDWKGWETKSNLPKSSSSLKPFEGDTDRHTVKFLTLETEVEKSLSPRESSVKC